MQSPDRAKDLALLRLADEAVRRGFTCMMVVVGDDRGLQTLGAGEKIRLRRAPGDYAVVAALLRNPPPAAGGPGPVGFAKRSFCGFLS